MGTWVRKVTCRFDSRVSSSMAGRRVGRRVPGVRLSVRVLDDGL